MEQTARQVDDRVQRFLRTGRIDPAGDLTGLAEACDRHISEQAKTSLSAAQVLARRYAKQAGSSADALRLSSNRVLARISHMNSRHAEAETAYLAARRLAGHDRMIQARIDRALVDVYMYLGNFAESRRRARRALAVFNEVKSEADVAMTRVNLANVLHRQDRHREAEQLYHAAAQFFEVQGNDRATARCYYNRANTLVQLFEMEEAARLYHESQRLYEAHACLIDATDARYGLAWLQMLQGKFHVALNELAACEETYRGAGQFRGAALCELDRAEVYLGLNLLGDAVEAATAAEGEFRKLKLRYERSKAAFFRAKASFALGRTREAKAALVRARAGFAAEQNDGFGGAVQLLESRMAGESPAARTLLRQARKRFASAQLPLWQAFCDLQAAVRNPKDRKALERLSDNKAAQAVPHLYAQWQTLLGDIAAEGKQMAPARRHWRRAADRLDAVRAQLPPIELRSSYGRNLDSPHRRLIDAELALHPRRAAAWVERYRTAGIWAPLSSDGAGDGQRQRVEESLAALAEQVAALSSHIAMPGERSLFSASSPVLGKLHRQVRQELARIEKGGGSEVERINRIGAAASELSREYPIVQFHLSEGDLVALIHEQGEVRVRRWPNGRAEAETIVRRLRFYLEKQLLAAFFASAETDSGEERFFTSLGDWLWSPLELSVTQKRVLLIPDGDLANLPWPAIRVGGEALIDRHQFILSPSIRHHLQACSVQADSKKIEVFIGRSDDLPEIGRELAVFRGVEGGHVCVHDPSGRESWPRDGSARAWHFAGHAVFRADNPFYSYLAMADSPMFAADFRLRRVAVDLVTLAACRSGQQVAMPGEESTGLVRSLLEMGARNVIAGHWPVADASTALWMTSFYDSYLKGASLHHAMQTAAHRVRETYPSAYHWAAFSLFGAGN